MMQGSDLGQIAQNFITYFGGAAGGLILAAALLVVGILAAVHVLPARFFWHSFVLGVCAWTATFMIRQFIGWA